MTKFKNFRVTKNSKIKKYADCVGKYWDKSLLHTKVYEYFLEDGTLAYTAKPKVKNTKVTDVRTAICLSKLF